MGRYGRRPLTNPYNLGKYSDRTVLRYTTVFRCWFSGDYYRLIAKNSLKLL